MHVGSSLRSGVGSGRGAGAEFNDGGVTAVGGLGEGSLHRGDEVRLDSREWRGARLRGPREDSLPTADLHIIAAFVSGPEGGRGHA